MSEFKSKAKLDILSIVSITIAVLAHIGVLVAIWLAKGYFAIYPSLFFSLIAIVICILLIVDVILFIGINSKDKVLRVIAIVISVFLTIGGFAGIFVLNKINDTIGDVFYSGEDRYYTVSGSIIAYDEKRYKTIEELKVDKFIVGVVNETTEGVTSIGKELLDDNKVDYGIIEYESMIECVLGLAAGDCDLAIVSSGYQSIMEADENNDYGDLFDHISVIHTFEKDIKDDTKVVKKDISQEPFNVLLIGYSRTELGSSVGLADAIIVASVNPKTYTVSLMSIPRDSYFPISCHNNKEMKINSGRSTSLNCFITDIETLLGEEIDFYVEADYQAIVNIVNKMGGLWIDNPVTFELDGQVVPEGHVYADGYMVLQFCRERHHMPNGDFDRQKHQKEVIVEICRELIERGDVNLVFDVIESGGSYLTTNLTINQITTIFNLILKTQNWTGLDTFDLVDFNQTRMTGYASWTYSYSWHFPIWIYKLYQGSITDSIDHMDYVLGKKVDVSDQTYDMQFSVYSAYQRPKFYREDYDEKEVHEVLPAMVGKLTKMTYTEACEWASKNNVKLIVNYITYGEAGYDETKVGNVVKQSPAYGALLSEYDTVEITVMGAVDESKIVPSLVGKNYNKAVNWCEKSGFKLKVTYVDSEEAGWTIISQSIDPYTNTDNVDTNKLYIEVSNPVSLKKTLNMTKSELEEWAKANMIESIKINYIQKEEGDGYTDSNYGKVVKYSCEDAEPDPTSKVVFSILAKSYKITVESEDEAKGTVTGSGLYVTGKEVKITATAKEGYKFDKWDDGDTNATRTITIGSEEKKYVAKFVKVYKLSASCNISGAGTIEGTGSYKEGTNVTLTVTANPHYIFSEWSDGVTDKSRTITIGTSNIDLVAKFTEETSYTASASYDSSMGSVSISKTTVYKGDSVTFTASAVEGYHFVQWNDGTTDPSITITVNEENVSVSAVFAIDE